MQLVWQVNSLVSNSQKKYPYLLVSPKNTFKGQIWKRRKEVKHFLFLVPPFIFASESEPPLTIIHFAPVHIASANQRRSRCHDPQFASSMIRCRSCFSPLVACKFFDSSPLVAITIYIGLYISALIIVNKIYRVFFSEIFSLFLLRILLCMSHFQTLMIERLYGSHFLKILHFSKSTSALT